MRRFRKIIDKSIPIVGMVIVFLRGHPDFGLQHTGPYRDGAGRRTDDRGRGVWKLTSPFLQSQRDYVELRAEVDGFILLCAPSTRPPSARARPALTNPGSRSAR